MFTPLDAFWFVVAIGLGAIVVGLILAMASHIFERFTRIIEAIERYAVRKEVVVETYDPNLDTHFRKIKNPLPIRVRLAKNGKALTED